MPASASRKNKKKSVVQIVEPQGASAVKRLAAARAQNNLTPPTAEEIFDFQLNFLRGSGLLVYTQDPAVMIAARPKRPKPGERVASYKDRVFGSRLVAVSFAQLKALDGRSSMADVQWDNVGCEIERLRELAGAQKKAAVEDAKREASKELEADRERLTHYPADWLEDFAKEKQDLNDRSPGHEIFDSRVIARLYKIVRDAQQSVEGGNPEGAPLEFIVGALVTAYEEMARQERRQSQHVKKLEVELKGKRTTGAGDNA